MCPFKVSSTASFHRGYNLDSFLEDMVNPLIKGWFILYVIDYGTLATWIGCDSLRLDNFSHDVVLYFHLQHMSQPAVDFQRISHPLTTTF